jgi:hypothetical protein
VYRDDCGWPPEIVADFYGWIPAIEEWLIKKCNTISERQLEQEEIQSFCRWSGERFY